MPLLVVDMWEHAYYLQYLNVKGDWVKAFWKVVNWEDVAGPAASSAHPRSGAVGGVNYHEGPSSATEKKKSKFDHVDWFEVLEMRGLVEKDRVKEFQVTVKIDFRLEEQHA